MICRSPIDGAVIGQVEEASPQEIEAAIERSRRAASAWRLVPAPKRGQLVSRVAEIVRRRKSELGAMVTLEIGKIPAEAEGEVQEWIDVCEFAVGLSRRLYGLTIASERPNHRMMEQWHPLGTAGIITAFNFPMAVWAWNAMIALVCGNSVIWKPSEKGALCAQAAQAVLDEAGAPEGLSLAIQGGSEAGRLLAESDHVQLVSATGSVAMGKAVAAAVAKRLGRCLLELGGNNAAILAPSADLELALPSIVFSAVGTAGQRCTSLRRLIVHESILSDVTDRLRDAYSRLTIGDPRQPGVLAGPLIDERAWMNMRSALDRAKREGGELVFGGDRVTAGVPNGGFYVRPAIVKVPGNLDIVREETFAPILYVMSYRDIETAIELQNGVRQGLSSAIFTNDQREAEWFLSPSGSDCGIANINLGTSGAEIGGAFGGEKDTGGGRESGSDAWKAYMRRATNTINYGRDLPLAQGVRFEI
ncbi:MAG TPA: aldehyde dehydrogenase family protein [Bryobacteraceae bacterium]|jgi:aldehyde dehydrogenase (NAD+)|nr:aldehyde dehydrogenase family protein [Bryobacteraceae bacterium]